MDRAKHLAAAAKGGRSAHFLCVAHEWTSKEARDAGRKGGIASGQRRREQREADAVRTDDIAEAYYDNARGEL
jgi:hypothetical protein